ncbi:hydantoinase B/oxoprolinase family protein [soil metagenome]
MKKETSNWQLWVDTGGTFTDCLGLDPQGQLHRVKVLSNSSLRGKVRAVAGPCSLHVKASWEKGQDIFTGYSFRLLSYPHSPLAVTDSDLAAGLLHLSSLPAGLPLEGLDFEISAGEEAPVLAARVLTGTPLQQKLPPMEMRLGTTKGTNALLEKKGAKVAFLVTEGFEDLLLIGTQQRPDLFALNIRKPAPLYQAVLPVQERLAAEGEVRQPLSEKEASRLVEAAKAAGAEAVAVALLHSYRNPAHERLLKEKLAAAGFRFVSCSAELAPAIKILPRAHTAVVDAYLAPLMETYLGAVGATLPAGSLKVMTSAGGLVGSGFFRPKDSLLSGPAGGVVGAAHLARLSGVTQLLTLDMGGTSTDVAPYDGKFDYRCESQVVEAQVYSPALAIETVAAGGGSICSFDGLALRVGPESAGAWPGPACYGAGGPLTLTDVNLLLGRLDPACFGIPLNKSLAEQALERLLEAIRQARGGQVQPEDLLTGLLQLANEKMAEAIRAISVSRGYDPAAYALLGFGGAGGQHVGQVARLLGMHRILIPYDAGLLSAYGMGQALMQRFAMRQVLHPLAEVQDQVAGLLEELEQEASRQLAEEGYGLDRTEVLHRLLYLRFRGQDAALEIELQPGLAVEAAFEEKYRALYGHWAEGQVIELESVKVVVSTTSPPSPAVQAEPAAYAPAPDGTIRTYLNGEWRPIPLFRWENLRPGASFPGPALVISATSTTVVEAAWELVLDQHQTALLSFNPAREEDSSEKQRGHSEKAKAAGPEEVQLALFTNRFRGIAEEMGALLQRTAFSVNVKERLDFSCALLDARGELVVNAPHIPVHLGSLGRCVRQVVAALPLGPGDVAITNHPGYGGSHLPDITLIRPVHTSEGHLVGYLANRAHHAELGGTRPGSMPPDAVCLAEEGVVIKPTYLVQGGKARWKEVEHLLMRGPFPTRALAENLADLNAALASLQAGEEALLALCATHGAETVQRYMDLLQAHAAASTRRGLEKLGEGTYEATEYLDDGSPLQVRVQVRAGKAVFDFSGSGPVHPRNLNANRAIVQSVLLYVLRLVADEEIPLNEGMVRQAEVHLPEGLLNPSFPDDTFACPAVVGGNTETSQRLVDTLLKALRLAACSQGTMNNVLFGNRRFGYYETIGGGTGAGKGFRGSSGVHQHMTNTRITDPETLELRYPVRLNRFALRRGSGGAGEWPGGDGIVRDLTFLEPVSLTVLTQHRREAPYGLAGGAPGQTGEQFLFRADGTTEKLEGTAGRDLQPGDRFLILTPGGGGYGTPIH